MEMNLECCDPSRSFQTTLLLIPRGFFAQRVLKSDGSGRRSPNAELEALSLIHFLRDQGQPQSEWLAALSADQTLSEPVRKRALQFAREWKP